MLRRLGAQLAGQPQAEPASEFVHAGKEHGAPAGVPVPLLGSSMLTAPCVASACVQVLVLVRINGMMYVVCYVASEARRHLRFTSAVATLASASHLLLPTPD